MKLVCLQGCALLLRSVSIMTFSSFLVSTEYRAMIRLKNPPRVRLPIASANVWALQDVAAQVSQMPQDVGKSTE